MDKVEDEAHSRARAEKLAAVEEAARQEALAILAQEMEADRAKDEAMQGKKFKANRDKATKRGVQKLSGVVKKWAKKSQQKAALSEASAFAAWKANTKAGGSGRSSPATPLKHRNATSSQGKVEDI